MGLTLIGLALLLGVVTYWLLDTLAARYRTQIIADLDRAMLEATDKGIEEAFKKMNKQS